MKMTKILICLLFFANISSTFACMNTYDMELHTGYYDVNYYLDKFKQKPPSNFEELNDYGVTLIHAKRYKEAIQIFSKLEKERKDIAQIAANLGTTYELDGQTELARHWIAQGIKRDPNIHEGSEWIHLKILDAQIAQRINSNWIKHNDVIGLNFGTKDVPKAKIKNIEVDGKKYSLSNIFTHSKAQMLQRLPFVDNDPITAQILFNMANIEVIQMHEADDAADVLYSKAANLGYIDQELLNARIYYINHSKWYKFKRFFVEIINVLGI